jgi:hypothetical protein
MGWLNIGYYMKRGEKRKEGDKRGKEGVLDERKKMRNERN